MDAIQGIFECLQKGQAPKVAEFTQAALDEGKTPKEIMDNGLIGAMAIVGAKFKKNEVYVPEVLIAARAMHAGLNIIKPLLADTGVESAGKIVLGTVKGDLHDIGKNLVGMMLEGGGFEVVDVGIDVTAETFVERVKESGATVVAMSALLTTTMSSMKGVVDALKAADLPVKTMIGGAPVTQAYADEIGADGYASDAASAVDIAKTLVG